jgi:hypothetical protein
MCSLVVCMLCTVACRTMLETPKQHCLHVSCVSHCCKHDILIDHHMLSCCSTLMTLQRAPMIRQHKRRMLLSKMVLVLATSTQRPVECAGSATSETYSTASTASAHTAETRQLVLRLALNNCCERMLYQRSLLDDVHDVLA